MQLRAGRVNFGAARRKGGSMSGPDFGFGMGQKANMHRLRRGLPLPQPE